MSELDDRTDAVDLDSLVRKNRQSMDTMRAGMQKLKEHLLKQALKEQGYRKAKAGKRHKRT